MSLQDILMERAALHFQNELGPTSGGTPSDLFSFIAETVKEEKKKKLEKEEYNANLKKSWDEVNRLKNSDKDRMEYQVEMSTDAKGNLIPSLAMKQKSQTVIPQGMIIKGADSSGKVTYEMPEEPTEKDKAMTDLYRAQTSLYSTMANGNGGTKTVYRDLVTGQEVPPEIAEEQIANGTGQYAINQVVPGKYGTSERPVVPVPDLTKEEKDYLITSDRINATLSTISNDIYPALKDKNINNQWSSFQAENVPFWMIGNQTIEDLKSAVNQLKADIPFLRGGKQLTKTEAKRVDVLVSPFGKSEETYKKDLERLSNEFLGGKQLMKYGLAPNPEKQNDGYTITSDGNKYKRISQ